VHVSETSKVSDPKWLAKAEDLAEPHKDGCRISVVTLACTCLRRERVQALALALEEAHAAGREEAMHENAKDELLVIRNAHAAGKAEGRREGLLEGAELAMLWGADWTAQAIRARSLLPKAPK
jgi:flagellar biosynthesis/type III secretory pathway protein FliH